MERISKFAHEEIPLINNFVAILISIAANGLIVAGIVALVLGYRARRGPRREQLAMLGDHLETRLEEMSRAIENIALEVERIGEAQRYALLVQQDRSTLSDARLVAGRSLTPH